MKLKDGCKIQFQGRLYGSKKYPEIPDNVAGAMKKAGIKLDKFVDGKEVKPDGKSKGKSGIDS